MSPTFSLRHYSGRSATNAVAINDNGRAAGWSGPGGIATVRNDTTPATLFNSARQALGPEQ